jgi:hypothetical protein
VSRADLLIFAERYAACADYQQRVVGTLYEHLISSARAELAAWHAARAGS